MEHYADFFVNLIEKFEFTPEIDSAFRFKVESFVTWFDILMSSEDRQAAVSYQKHSILEVKLFFESFVSFHEAKSTVKVVNLIRKILALYAANCLCCLCNSQSVEFDCKFKFRKSIDDSVRNFAHIFHRLLVKMQKEGDSEIKFRMLDVRFKAHLTNCVNWVLKKGQLSIEFKPTSSIGQMDQTCRDILLQISENSQSDYHYLCPLFELIRKVFNFYHDNCYCLDCCPERKNLTSYFINTRSYCIRK